MYQKIGEQEISFSTLTLFCILLTLDNSEFWDITRLDNVPSNHRYIKFVFNNVMSDSNIMNVGKETKCPICKTKFIEHSELQDKICKMITIKQFANNSPGFDVQHRPFFED